MRKTISAMLFISLSVYCLSCSKEPDTRGQGAPSVFVIVIDAASAHYIGCYGDTHGTSPNIDQFAAEGVLFENAYSQTPTTVTSTTSLMTGVRTTTHLMTDTTVLDEKFKTMPQMFSDHGMTCYGVIGNPFAGAPATGLNRGYAECVQVYALESLKSKRRVEESSKFLVTLPEDITGETYNLLPKMKPNGTFSYIHFLQPHKPYTPPESFLRHFNAQSTDWNTLHTAWIAANQPNGRAAESTIRGLEARYRANVRYVDAAIGELFEKLKKAGLYDESVIVVMSDHGEAFFKHKQFGHNSTLYDDMTRIPMIMKFPKSVGVKPRRVKQPVETIDVLPTLCEFLKLTPPAAHEGDSLWGLCTGDTNTLPGEEVITCTIQRSRHAVRLGDFKYVYNTRGALEELYNLRNDPDEQHNLTQSDPDTSKKMREVLVRSVDLVGGKTLAQASKLRDDPRMKELTESLGYSAKGIDEEYGFDPANATSQPASQPATTQPTTTQPTAAMKFEGDGDC